MKKMLVIVLVLLSFGCGNEIKTFSDNDIIIDVRSSSEYKKEHIKNAQSLPLEEIEENRSSVVKDKDAKIYVYCQSGTRSAIALTKLEELGYTNVENLGGISDKFELEGE